MAAETGLPEFSDYVGELLDQVPGSTVVEVGTDNVLRLAGNLASRCADYIAVTLPSDYSRAEFGYDMLGGHRSNIRLEACNALDLSGVVTAADFVIIHNVLLQLEEDDTALMWRYRRGEIPCSDEQWNALVDKFREAEHRGFAEFCRVSAGGRVIDFRRTVLPEQEGLKEMLLEHGIARPEQLSVVQLAYDGGEATDAQWEATIIDNRV